MGDKGSSATCPFISIKHITIRKQTTTTPSAVRFQKLRSPWPHGSYLRVLEEGGDASDVQTEASRRASRSVNTGGEERVVLLPGAHAPGAQQQRRNPQAHGRAHAHAPGKHGSPACLPVCLAACVLLPSCPFYPRHRSGQILRAGSAGETKETSIIHWGGATRARRAR